MKSQVGKFFLWVILSFMILNCKEKTKENLPTTYELATYIFSCNNQDKNQSVLVVDVITKKVGDTKKDIASISKLVLFDTQNISAISTAINNAFFDLEINNPAALKYYLKSGIFFEKLKKVSGFKEVKNISQLQLSSLLRGEKTLISSTEKKSDLLFDIFSTFSTPVYAQQSKVDSAIVKFMNGLIYLPNCSIDIVPDKSDLAFVLLQLQDIDTTPFDCNSAMKLLATGTKDLWDGIVKESVLNALNPNSDGNSAEIATILNSSNNNNSESSNAGSWGDPHFTTLDGSYYDFQGVGEYQVLKSTNDNLQLQVRQQGFGNSKTASINTAIAYNNGSDIVSLYLNPNKIFVNRKEANFSFNEIALSNGGKITKNGGLIEIKNSNGDVLKVIYVSNYLNYILTLNQNRKGKVNGLLGNFDGNKLNDLATKSGVSVNFSDSKVFYSTFSDSWRISQNESLFEYDSGKSTLSFTDKNFPSEVYSISQDKYQEALKICTDAGVTTNPALSSCVYDIALTGRAEWAKEYLSIQKTFKNSGLIAYYPFNGNANDESGNSNHGQIYGATLTADRKGKPNSAYSFDGNKQYIRVPNSFMLHGLGQEVTMSAWVLWKNAVYAGILCKASSSEQQLQFQFYRPNQNTKDAFFHTSGKNVPESKFQLEMGQWIHVVLLVDGTTRRFYVNGEFVGGTQGYPLIKPNYSPLDIGRDDYFITEYHTGLIDDIRIYNRVLSNKEIKELSQLDN